MNPSSHFRKNIGYWLAIYAIWFVWESMFRVLLEHRDWGMVQSIRYMGLNLFYGLIWSLILGTVHNLLLSIPFTKRLLTPVAGICIAALAAVPILVSYHNYLVHTQYPMLFRWLSAFLILGFIYATCIIIAKRLTPLVSRVMVKPKEIFLFLAVVPLLTLGVSPFVLNRQNSQVTRGPIHYVVLISIDTLRYDYVGAYGSSPAQTPVMDQVASEGVRFENAIASVPLTGPSHVSMFTGQSPLTTGVFYNGQPLSSKATTVTSLLRGAGFRTGGFVSGYPMKTINSGLNQGFQAYDERLSWMDFFNETFYGRIVDALPVIALGILRQAKEVTDPALHWLEKNSGEAFFLFVHYYDCHYPYGRKSSSMHLRNSFRVTAKPEDVDNQKRLYAQEVETVDGQIGRIVEFLKRRGIYDQTLLIITSDHGESLGEHGYYYGHGFYVYEQLVRVPMILRCPGLLKPGVVVQEQVALMDIPRTILGAVGLNSPDLVGGYNLLQVAQAPKIVAERDILSHTFVQNVHGLRTNDWKLIKNPGNEKYELYDLKTDPQEINNLYKTNTEMFVRLRHSFEERMSSRDNTREKWSPKDLSAEQIERLKSLGYLN